MYLLTYKKSIAYDIAKVNKSIQNLTLFFDTKYKKEDADFSASSQFLFKI